MLILKVTGFWQGTTDIRLAPAMSLTNRFISVIVIARNEALHIESCLQSITLNAYPTDDYEIILVDDHSDDQTIEKARTLNIKNLTILSLANTPQLSGKKAALQYAISHAKGDIIACTDADCRVQPQWLSIINQSLRLTSQSMITQLISYDDQETVLSRFQTLDLMATMAFYLFGINQKRFYSANGANMAFKKSAYQQGDLQTEIASGDDVFLIQAIAKRNPGAVRFIKSKVSIVSTGVEQSFSALLRQRWRWATKSKAYADSGLFKLQSFVLIFHLYIIINLALGALIWPLMIFTGLFALFLKGIADYLLLNEVSQYYRQPKALKWYVLSFLLYFPYIGYMATAAIFGKRVQWKGRELR